ncbi:MAG: YqgE/AlgH family protein [Luteolibacter sp.]
MSASQLLPTPCIVLEILPSPKHVSRVAGDSSSSEFPISLSGQLLLASPALADGTFHRSVILIAEHSSSEGAIGTIINHCTETTVGDVLPDPAFAALHHLPIHHGGPVSTGELSFSSFSWANSKSLDYAPRISAKHASELILTGHHIVRATVGHSGWAAGQLEDELKRNTWITLRPSAALFNHPHDLSLWTDLLKGISPYHHLLAEAPKNPFLN